MSHDHRRTTRRRVLQAGLVGGAVATTGCLRFISGGGGGETTSAADSGNTLRDSDGDGVVNTEDYAPWDPEVQEKSDLTGGETAGGQQGGETPTEGTPAEPPEVTTAIATGLPESTLYDISNADDAGRLHVAYTDGQTLSYARVSSRGDVEQTETLAELPGPVEHIHVVSDPAGWAHVLYDHRKGENRPQVVRRITLDPNGLAAVDETVKEESGNYWLYLFDALVVDDEVFAVVKESPDGPDAWNTLWRLPAEETGGETRRLDIPSEYGVTDGVQLSRDESRLYVGYAYGRKLSGPGTLGMNVYELGTELDAVSKTKIPSQGEGENWTYPSQVTHPSGTVLMAYTRGPKGSHEAAGVVAYDPDGQEVTATLYEDSDPRDENWHADVAVIDDGSVVVGIRDSFGTYSPEFETLGVRQGDLGRVQVGVNGSGQPSLLGLSDDGELTYRAVTVGSE